MMTTNFGLGVFGNAGNVDEVAFALFLDDVEDCYTELLCKEPKDLDYSQYEDLYDCEWEHHPARIEWVNKVKEWLTDKKRYEEVLTYFHRTTLIEVYKYFTSVQ